MAVSGRPDHAVGGLALWGGDPKSAAPSRSSSRPVPSPRLPARPGRGDRRQFRFQRAVFFTALYLQDQLDLAAASGRDDRVLARSVRHAALGGRRLLRRAGPRLLMLVGMALMTAARLLLPGGLRWLVVGLAVAGIGQLRHQYLDHRSDGRGASRSRVPPPGVSTHPPARPQVTSAIARAVFQTIESRGLLTAIMAMPTSDPNRRPWCVDFLGLGRGTIHSRQLGAHSAR